MARYEARLVDGPVLILPRTSDLNYSFNPNQLIPLGERGMVYPTFRATSPWGILEASDGTLMTGTELRLSAPEEIQSRPLKGTGWSLDLAPGWRLDPGPRKGDYRLVPEPPPALNAGSKDAR